MIKFSKKLNLFPLFLVMITLMVNSPKIGAQACNIDECMDVIHTIGPTITDPNCGPVQTFTGQGCMTDATPEAIVTQCGASQYPTVWFKVEVDDIAVQFASSVEVEGTWFPKWAIYSGECDSLSLVGGFLNPNNPCSDSDPNNNVHKVGVLPNIHTFYIAVSGRGSLTIPTLN